MQFDLLNLLSYLQRAVLPTLLFSCVYCIRLLIISLLIVKLLQSFVHPIYSSNFNIVNSILQNFQVLVPIFSVPNFYYFISQIMVLFTSFFNTFFSSHLSLSYFQYFSMISSKLQSRMLHQLLISENNSQLLFYEDLFKQ